MTRPRASQLGIRIGTLKPGEDNAITDVQGVLVGHCTLSFGDGELVVGKGPVRTGVTVVRPHPGNMFREKVKCAVHVINGFGKSVGLSQIEELGTLETPIALTNTLSVGVALDALVQHALAQNPEIGVTTGTVNGVVAECNDGFLNDIRGRHVRTEHVLSALEEARSGPVPEGAVGAGTGMTCFGFKGGIGTASRTILDKFCLGVLVLANFGAMRNLTVAGVPVGRRFCEDQKCLQSMDKGSVVIVVATDAPLDVRQLKRVAKRAAFGLGRVGSFASHGSGDYVFAFSTKNREQHFAPALFRRHEVFLTDGGCELDLLFEACAEAVEEAVLNALLSAETTSGRDDNIRYSLPHEKLLSFFVEHGRLLHTHGTKRNSC